MGGRAKELNAARPEALDYRRDDCVSLAVDPRPDDRVVGKVLDRRLEPENAVLIVELAMLPAAEYRPMGDERLLDLGHEVHGSDHYRMTRRHKPAASITARFHSNGGRKRQRRAKTTAR
jgi:hypothetical protein